MKEIELTLFAIPSPLGKDLVRLLETLFNSGCLGELKVNMKTIFDGDQEDMMISGLLDDVVIFDASFEDKIGSNYRAAQMYPCTMDHFLVVSRTRLPLNFQPFHDGGTPDTSENISEHPHSLSNDYLVNWIKKQLKKLESRLPRPQDERLYLKKGENFINFPKILGLVTKLIGNSVKRQEQHWKNTGRSFISYLSRYSNYHRFPVKANGYYVENLIDYIKKQHNNENYTVRYYPPGTLSSEFMTEQRRWQIVSFIEWRIRASNEFWIFETEDYYNSWWTLAELACLAYIASDSRHSVPQIFIAKPISEGLIVKQVEQNFIPNIDSKLLREFGRFLSNSDPRTMGDENIPAMQKIAKLPQFFQWLGHQGMKFVVKSVMDMMAVSEEIKQVEKEFDFNRHQEMVHSPVLSDSFRTDRIITCPNCASDNKIKNSFEFDKFLYHQQPGQLKVSEEKMQAIITSGIWTCKKCNHRISFVKENYEQLIWLPAKPDSKEYIKKNPVYTFKT